MTGARTTTFPSADALDEGIWPTCNNVLANDSGLGLGFYQRSVSTSYTAQVNTDGSEIAQTLKLRIVPFTATFKVLPFGTRAPIQPYIGAGVGVMAWRYSETGQFLDAKKRVFSDNFVGSGTATGPLILGGVRVPTSFGTIGGEVRYQAALGNLPESQDFAGTKIDLGGFHYLFTISVKF